MGFGNRAMMNVKKYFQHNKGIKEKILRVIIFKTEIIFIRLALLHLVLLQGACSFQSSKVHEKANAGANPSKILERPVPYTEVFERVFTKRCISCHNKDQSNGGTILDDYEPTVAKIAEILKSTIIEKRMPKNAPSLPADEAQLLNSWIQQGATREGRSLQEAQRESVAQNWRELQSTALRTCADCHGGTNPEANYDVSSLPLFQTKVDIVFKRLILDKDHPPEPYAKLTPAERIALAQWIAKGMPE